MASKLQNLNDIANRRFSLDIHFGEDTIFNIVLYSENSRLRICFLNAPLYFYYGRPGSLSNSTNFVKHLNIAKWLKDQLDNLLEKDICLMYIYKYTFNYRYENSFTAHKAVSNKEARKIFKSVNRYLFNEKKLSIAEKIKILIAAYFPSIYRARLLNNDPTMREYEKRLKSDR